MEFFSGTDEYGRFYDDHCGASAGGWGKLIIYPEEKVVVAVITNDSRVKAGDELLMLAEIFVGDDIK